MIDGRIANDRNRAGIGSRNIETICPSVAATVSSTNLLGFRHLFLYTVRTYSKAEFPMAATASTVLSFRPIDEIEVTLLDSWREVSKATHRFLVLLREFDLRQGWKAYGNGDCAEWLDWKCGIARVTAQEKVRVAKALWSLPRIDAAFERGELSYSKVRAMSRVATDKNEEELLRVAIASSAAQVEAYCRRLRNGDAIGAAEDARRLHEARSLTRAFHEDGSGALHVELPRAELELVLSALEFVGRSLPEDPSRSLFAKGADALLLMARDALAGRTSDGAAGENYQVMVHVDAEALCGNNGESDLPLPTVKRLCCDGAVTAMGARRNGPRARRRPQAPHRFWRAEESSVRARSRVHVPGMSPHALSRCASRATLGRRRRDEPREPARALHGTSHACA